MRILKEPLFHFFLFGLLIFGWYAYLNPADPAESDPRIIVIDAQRMDSVIQQFRTTWRRPPTREELEKMVQATVREEILVREAQALGLDRGDGMIRNRLRQKMEFLTASVAQSVQPGDELLIDHMKENAERFTRPQRVAFEQVAFGQVTSAEPIDAARAALESGADPGGLGTISLLPPAMPLTPKPEVDRAFGKGFGDALMQLPVGEWSGPVRSGYGYHLVRVVDREEARLPPLDEIRDKVLADWQSKMTAELTEAQYEVLKARYSITLPDLNDLGRELLN